MVLKLTTSWPSRPCTDTHAEQKPLRRCLDYFRYRLLLMVHILLSKETQSNKAVEGLFVYQHLLFGFLVFCFGLTILPLSVHSCLLTSSCLLKLALSIMTQLNHTSPHNVFLHFQSMDSVNNQKADNYKVYIPWHKALCHLVKNNKHKLMLFFNV